MRFFRTASLIFAAVFAATIGYGNAESGQRVDTERSETHGPAIDEHASGSASLSAAIEQNPALNESVDGLEAVEHPDGMRSVALEERFTNYVVLTVSPDQEVSTLCTTDLEAVLARIEAARNRDERGE